MLLGCASATRSSRQKHARFARAFEEMEAALATFDTLPLPVLEALRNYVADEAKGSDRCEGGLAARLRNLPTGTVEGR